MPGLCIGERLSLSLVAGCVVFLPGLVRAPPATGGQPAPRGPRSFRRISAALSRPQLGDFPARWLLLAACGSGVAPLGGLALAAAPRGPGGPSPSPMGTRGKGALRGLIFLKYVITEAFPACPHGLANCLSATGSVPVTVVFPLFFLICPYKPSFGKPPQPIT